LAQGHGGGPIARDRADAQHSGQPERGLARISIPEEGGRSWLPVRSHQW
jgi:hypothetical protein